MNARLVVQPRTSPEEAERFDALSEEDQVLERIAQHIENVWNSIPGYQTKEQIARALLHTYFGPKFRDRVLGDAQLCRKIGLID